MTATVVKLGEEWFEYADVLVDVMIGYACNVQCDYCSVTDEMRKENMATAPVMAALAEARRRGLLTVAMVGYGGGRVAAEGLADHVVVTRSEHIPRIQEAQASAYHVLCELVDGG